MIRNLAGYAADCARQFRDALETRFAARMEEGRVGKIARSAQPRGAPRVSDFARAAAPSRRDAQPTRAAHVTPFAANVCFTFGDTRNLIKLSAVVRCGAAVISAAVYGIELCKSPGNGPR